MAALPNLITTLEADAILAPPTFSDWVSQAPALKEFHINQASTYTRTHWACTDEDFTTPALSDDAKRAVAYYAEASRAGNLYGSISVGKDGTGGKQLTELTQKVGSLEKTEKWSEGSVSDNSTIANPLAMADDVFNMLGCSVISQNGSQIKLVRT